MKITAYWSSANRRDWRYSPPGSDQPDVVSELKSYLAKLPGAGRPGKGEPYLGIVHRLDQPVEGLLVFAKDKKAAAALSKQLTEGALNKHYYAVLCGYPDCPEGDLVDYLRKEGNVAVAVTGREPGICRCEDCHAALSHFGRDQRSISACACRCNDRDRTVSSDPGAVRTCGISTVGRYEVWNGSAKRGDALRRNIAAWHYARTLWNLSIPFPGKRWDSG